MCLFLNAFNRYFNKKPFTQLFPEETEYEIRIFDNEIKNLLKSKWFKHISNIKLNSTLILIIGCFLLKIKIFLRNYAKTGQPFAIWSG